VERSHGQGNSQYGPGSTNCEQIVSALALPGAQQVMYIDPTPGVPPVVGLSVQKPSARNPDCFAGYLRGGLSHSTLLIPSQGAKLRTTVNRICTVAQPQRNPNRITLGTGPRFILQDITSGSLL
jgi:hypothetical protein